jgi:hypothetical protein
LSGYAFKRAPECLAGGIVPFGGVCLAGCVPPIELGAKMIDPDGANFWAIPMHSDRLSQTIDGFGKGLAKYP